MNSKKSLVIIFLLIVLLTVVYMFKIDNKETKKDSKNELTQAEQKVKKITSALMEKGVSEKQLEKLIGEKVDTYYVAIGSASYVRQGSLSDGIDLNDYEAAQKKYANQLEEKVKKNFEYTIDKKTKSVEENSIISVTFKSYYYSNYLDDLSLLAGRILKMQGYTPSTDFLGKETNESKADIFKSKIKAIEILNNHLDAYYNNYEYTSMDIVTYEKQRDNTEALTTYLQGLAGVNYKATFGEVGTSDYDKKQNERINYYIQEAINNGSLDKQNPLKLK